MADAFASIQQVLQSYGLGQLTDWAHQEFIAGKNMDEIMLDLRSQPVFRQQFSAIFDREAKGLPPVSVQDIVNYRRDAAQKEMQYGLPHGFVSDWEHVNRLMGADVSANELDSRLKMASTASYGVPQDVRDQLSNLYGVDQGHLAAFFADPDHAQPYLEKAFTSSQYAAAAARERYGQLSQQEAEQLAVLGKSVGNADMAFDKLNADRQLFQSLPGESGFGGVDRQTQLAFAAGDPGAARALALAGQERVSEFRGASDFTKSSGGVSGEGRAY